MDSAAGHRVLVCPRCPDLQEPVAPLDGELVPGGRAEAHAIDTHLAHHHNTDEQVDR